MLEEENWKLSDAYKKRGFNRYRGLGREETPHPENSPIYPQIPPTTMAAAALNDRKRSFLSSLSTLALPV